MNKCSINEVKQCECEYEGWRGDEEYVDSGNWYRGRTSWFRGARYESELRDTIAAKAEYYDGKQKDVWIFFQTAPGQGYHWHRVGIFPCEYSPVRRSARLAAKRTGAPPFEKITERYEIWYDDVLAPWKLEKVLEPNLYLPSLESTLL